MNWDFGNEEEQTEYTHAGPVPEGSVVVVEMSILDPDDSRKDGEEPLVKVSQSGLRMLYVELFVTRGQYQGCSWRQHIMLPEGMQKASLSPGQQTACRIGGAMLKAMLQAAKKPMRITSLNEFAHLRFPVKVRINPRPVETKSGETYWVNDIARVITPDKPEYAQAARDGEIINLNGAVAGKARQAAAGRPESDPFAQASPPKQDVDSVPF